MYSALTKNQHNALYNRYVQIKSLIKKDSITLATKHVMITTIFKYMPSDNSHITLYTHRNPYSTPETNTSMIGSACARARAHTHKHTHTHTHTHICTHILTHTYTHIYMHTHTHTRTHTHTHTHTPQRKRGGRRV